MEQGDQVTPEASLKRRLRTSFDMFFPTGWHTSLRGGMMGQKSGLPDSMWCADGKTVWIESKVAPRNLTQLQGKTGLTLAMTGGMRVWCLTFHPASAIYELHSLGGRPWAPIQRTSLDLNFWKDVFA